MLIRAALGLCLAALAIVFVLRTWHWPLVGDAPLMHYVVFLMDHGLAPYRDIVDINLPGTYALEAAVMHLFGGGSLAWRLFDLGLCAVITAAMIVISLPYDALAGLFAGVLFLLLHGRDGLIDLGQRDLEIAALLLLAYACLFRAMRSETMRLPGFLLFGLLAGMAATIKPFPLALGAALLAGAAFTLHRRGQPWVRFILAGGVAFVLPWLLALGWLAHEHALHDFSVILFQLIPEHAGLRRQSAGYLLKNAISSVTLPLVLLWLPVAIHRRFWRTWEGAALLLGVLFGALSFYAQGKGYPYHRYPMESLLLLMIALDFTMALREPTKARGKVFATLSVAGLVFGLLVTGLGSLRHAIRYDWHNQEFDTMLRADLTQLGGQQLNHQVQCLDVAAGCLNALYRMNLVQSTGFLYDCYLLSPEQNATGEAYRGRFLDEIREHPPRAFVVTSHECGLGEMTYHYDELRDWPQFADYLSAHYALYADRVPPHRLLWAGEGTKPFGYRIYVRKEQDAGPITVSVP
ncbi:hypothetical protein [Silvibacterium dinghuense]|uniref:Glycosyltransferase RgtA/B/C/D-like domain-containing protein n=1 Tax=Silvibacterium dinghuense TaxID=1560006 RepID=A0A4Q1SH75_9BACT|nr:hypothetical protein [Silvibacterium dinghuense]RXS96520.1 hypothetical protein ESZ00_00760 [Silvibacterium dinghuense]GGG91489.1 hypothetical protein GCM10011586_02590 [Silvibacterium dinghuense]